SATCEIGACSVSSRASCPANLSRQTGADNGRRPPGRNAAPESARPPAIGSPTSRNHLCRATGPAHLERTDPRAALEMDSQAGDQDGGRLEGSYECPFPVSSK